MVDDLHRFIRLYDTALQLREDVRRTQANTIVTTVATTVAKQRASEFKPKNDSDYQQAIQGRLITKSRRHETLVREYGEFLQSRGFSVATNVHPRDMTSERDGQHWLIEAKVVGAGDGVSATREALGQLFAYKFLHYDPSKPVMLLALFSESVGPLCVELLEHLGIAAVWHDGTGWAGSDPAAKAQLA